MIKLKHLIPIIKNLFKKHPKREGLPVSYPDRKISLIVIHCTATPKNTKVESIRQYWKLVKGWTDPGYHYLIDAMGDIHHLQDIRLEANGAKGFNAGAIHIAYVGGVDEKGVIKDTRTRYQNCSLHIMVQRMTRKFPKAIVIGHRDLPGVAKECPCFDAKLWWDTVKKTEPSYFLAGGMISYLPKMPVRVTRRKITAKKAAH